MKISFCVTYYNQQEFVEQSIKSILAIEMPCDFEILIGDDGSTDNTIKKVQELQKQYPDKIRYYVMSRDNNVKYNSIYRVSANRLNLVENATGDYIMFLDGDDCYCDKTFIIDALNQFKKDPKLIACAFNYQKFFPDKNIIEVPKQKFKVGKLDIKKYIKKCWYLHSGAIVFKNIIDQKKLLYLKNSKNFDDNVITIYMFQFGNVYYVDRPIYSYQQIITNSIWTSKTEIERVLECAMFYEHLPSIIPYFKNCLIKRRYPIYKKLYKNRKNLKELLGNEKYQKYLEENERLGNNFICDLLHYNESHILKKFLIMLNFWKLKLNFI